MRVSQYEKMAPVYSQSRRLISSSLAQQSTMNNLYKRQIDLEGQQSQRS